MENTNMNGHIEEMLLDELEEEQLDVIEYKFKKPVNFEGEDYSKITLDLESLTGKDVKEVSSALSNRGEVIGLAETNKAFLAGLAARSARLPMEFTDYIPARDFSKITMDVQNFLLG